MGQVPAFGFKVTSAKHGETLDERIIRLRGECDRRQAALNIATAALNAALIEQAEVYGSTPREQL